MLAWAFLAFFSLLYSSMLFISLVLFTEILFNLLRICFVLSAALFAYSFSNANCYCFSAQNGSASIKTTNGWESQKSLHTYWKLMKKRKEKKKTFFFLVFFERNQQTKILCTKSIERKNPMWNGTKQKIEFHWNVTILFVLLTIDH